MENHIIKIYKFVSLHQATEKCKSREKKKQGKKAYFSKKHAYFFQKLL